jgi:hypothetical protein
MSGTRFIVLALGAALAAPGGCKSATTRGSDQARVKTEIADNLSDFKVEEVAVLGLSNTTGDEEAELMSRYVMEALHEAGQFHVVPAPRLGQDAERTGVGEDYKRLFSTWQKTNRMDARIVQHVLGATGYDAVLGIVVTKWEEVKIDATQEGTSDTSVGLVLKLFAADGTLLWSASDLKTEHSIAYLPSYNTKSTMGGRAVTTAPGGVPDPPPVEKVALEMARNVVSTMPEFKANEGGE